MDHEHVEHGISLSVYLWHFAAGVGFAGIGIFARQFCEHRWHQVVVGLTLIALETAIVVPTVG